MTARRLILVVILCAVGVGTRVFVAEGGLNGYNWSIGTDLILICVICVLMVATLKYIKDKPRRRK